MELVNLKNGAYSEAIQWTLNNTKAIKKFLSNCIANGIWNVDDLFGYNNVKLHYQSTKDNDLNIYFTKENNVSHHIITIPAHDYIMVNPSQDITSVPSQRAKNDYGKPNITKKGFVNNKTSIHYYGFQYNGSWTSIPKDLACGILNCSNYKKDSNHIFYIKLDIHENKSLVIKPKNWFLLEAGDGKDDDFEFVKPKVVTPEQLKKNYHSPKPVKLPKYLFTATETISSYDERYTSIIGTASTYKGAKKLVAKTDKLHREHNTDPEDYKDLYYDITPNKTNIKDISNKDI